MTLSKKYPYIVIEGPIGSGKTTLANKLSERFRATAAGKRQRQSIPAQIL